MKFVIGHFNSGVTMPASEVYQENGILQITPAATNPRITERNMWNIFRICGRDDQQGAVAGDYILKKFKGKKIAVVHDKTTYGQGLADETKATINKGGMKEVLYEGVNKDDKDFSALVSKVKASGADLIYWGGLHDTGGLILRQMRDQGVKAPLMGGDGITDDEFASIAGPGAEGTLMTYGPDPRKRPEAKDGWTNSAPRISSRRPTRSTAMPPSRSSSRPPKRRSRSTPRRSPRQIKSGMKFKTVIGDLSYDKKGDVTRLDYVIYVWKKALPARSPTPRSNDPAARPDPACSSSMHGQRDQPMLCSTGNVSINQLFNCVKNPARKPMPVSTSRPPITRSTWARWERKRTRKAANGSTANAATMNGTPSPNE